MANARRSAVGRAAALVLVASTNVSPQRGEATEGRGDWRPNGPSGGVGYVGSRTCAQCHWPKVESQSKTPMGQALQSPGASEVLAAHPKLQHRSGRYETTISRTAGRTVYEVSDGESGISVPILYSFGKGEAAQTYLLEHQGRFYESQVTFFAEAGRLGPTLGHPPRPASLKQALGRELDPAETRACFGCHSTNSVTDDRLHLDQLMEGVSCEACHGPGEKHVEAMKRGRLDDKGIFNPGRLGTEGVVDFCGSCHRTWEQVALQHLRGLENVRFQPYRLANSKCYNRDDARISCLACHDPHEPRKRDAAFYDSKCAACHRPGSQPEPRAAGVCPVGKANCASCHMPQYKLPGAPIHFNDHHIRIARPGDPYPN